MIEVVTGSSAVIFVAHAFACTENLKALLGSANWEHHAYQYNHVAFIHLSRGHYQFNGGAAGHSLGRSGTFPVRYRDLCDIYSADSQPLD